MAFPRISHDPAVMGGKPCIRGLRITVGTVVDQIASGCTRERILQAYPQLEPADIDAAIGLGAWSWERAQVSSDSNTSAIDSRSQRNWL